MKTSELCQLILSCLLDKSWPHSTRIDRDERLILTIRSNSDADRRAAAVEQGTLDRLGMPEVKDVLNVKG